MGFSRNLEELMKKLDITQEEIAKKAKVTPGAVSGWRRGSRPRKEAIRNLCVAFEVTEDDLLSDEFGLASKSFQSGGGHAEGTIPFIDMGNYPRGEADPSTQSQIIVPRKLLKNHPGAYALMTEDDGMSRLIPRGSHVIIDPDMGEPRNGSVAVVKLLDPILFQEFGSLRNMRQNILLRRWYLGTTNVMLAPFSYRDDAEDIIVKKDDISTSIEVLGTVIWFQSAGEIT